MKKIFIFVLLLSVLGSLFLACSTDVDLYADYSGAEVPDAFVVGYGLDYAQKYRNLPYIGVIELDPEE